jgi:hypothetical protein
VGRIMVWAFLLFVPGSISIDVVRDGSPFTFVRLFLFASDTLYKQNRPEYTEYLDFQSFFDSLAQHAYLLKDLPKSSRARRICEQ